MKKIIALALALVMLLSLCGCSLLGGILGGGSNLTGTYKLYAMQYDEEHIVLADDLFEEESYITLKSGGSAEMSMEGDVANVGWTADGEKLRITAADGDMDGTIKDGILTLDVDGTALYFAAEGADTSSIGAVSLDELTDSIAAGILGGGSDLQQMWNGWYFGCIDMEDCTGQWEALNGSTYDAVMYVELDTNGVGKFGIYDPFGDLIGKDNSSVYIQGECHADENYLYGDSGMAFSDELHPSDWVFVHNTSDPEKIHVGSESYDEESDATIGYEFQFKPWGDRWEGDNYTQFIPHFDAYIDAIEAGLESPFGDSFTGFGIAEPATKAESTAPAASGSALGADAAKLDIGEKGVVFVSYPADEFVYDDTYGKLKNEDSGVGILIDPMLGSTNLAELKASYEKNNSDEDDYSLKETTVGGYNALILKYSDWLGATMRVDVDFGGNHDGYYGMSFAVSGDSLADCDTDVVWAIIESMEVK